jgi:hypothetical protein
VRRVRDDLDRHVRAAGYIDEVPDLVGHRLAAADLALESVLVEDAPHPRRGLLGEDAELRNPAVSLQMRSEA